MRKGKNYKFVFVILHYITLDDTIECIDSILNNVEWPNMEIVVVDNGSPNKSGSMIQNLYAKNMKVHVLILKENLGFAKGNNVGYRYAKYQLKADFIALINNDTLVTQKEFIEKIIDKYEHSLFHILGPDIISLKDNSHQNPVRNSLISKKELKKFISKLRLLVILNLLGLERPVRFLKQNLSKQENSFRNKDNEYYLKELENVQLHGSCLVFSPEYVKRYEGLYDKTFMYMEEDILFYIAQRDNLKTLFYPAVYIYHKEDASTEAIYRKERRKRLFIYLNTLRSAKILLDLINKN